MPVILLVSFSTEAAEAKFKEVMASYDKKKFILYLTLRIPYFVDEKKSNLHRIK